MRPRFPRIYTYNPNTFLCLTITTATKEESMIQEFLKDEQGQDIVEYSLLLVLIGAAAVFVLTAMGTSISQIFSKINGRLSTANEKIS